MSKRIVNGVELPFGMTPATVRIGIKNYERLKLVYKRREETNTFAKSSKGSKTYLVNTLKAYERWIEKWGWLKDIYLDNRGNQKLQNNH